MQTVFGPAKQQSEDRAVRTARALADRHIGVIAWSREAKLELGEYGEPTVLFQHGDLPDTRIAIRQRLADLAHCRAHDLVIPTALTGRLVF